SIPLLDCEVDTPTPDSMLYPEMIPVYIVVFTSYVVGKWRVARMAIKVATRGKVIIHQRM
ncbi:MAG: hypothetical protein RR220_09285, partial [Bacteroidaceae bacterium]